MCVCVYMDTNTHAHTPYTYSETLQPSRYLRAVGLVRQAVFELGVAVELDALVRDRPHQRRRHACIMCVCVRVRVCVCVCVAVELDTRLHLRVYIYRLTRR